MQGRAAFATLKGVTKGATGPVTRPFGKYTVSLAARRLVMESIQTLVVITVIIIGFGLMPLLGALLPRDDEDER